MELQSISYISKIFNISTRTLRYYEQIGLIQSTKKEDFAYRTYDKDTVLRLQQIIILRKLRIPLKQIAKILQSNDSVLAITTFQQNLDNIEDEITSLTTIKNVILSLLERLHLQSDVIQLLDDISMLEVVDSLTASKINFKEDVTMEELNTANEKLNKLTDRDVRIIYLPPATVAAAHFIGDGPEGPAGEMLHAFIKESNLKEKHPAARCFGFNSPNPDMREDGKYGYEFQVTIPDDMEVPAPLTKKHFEGGLYAAYMILMDEIDGIGWSRLYESWLKDHEIWEGNLSPTGENMNGLLEEHLNILHWLDKGNLEQVDLLLPIKRKAIE